jgi:CRISPR-associated protein Csx3
MAKVIFGGPPHSGKSVLREGLKKALMRIEGAPYPYIITGCPDGEGSWFQEAAERSPDTARALKERYKSLLEGFSPDFVERVAKSVKRCKLPLTLVDIGGIPSEENEKICEHATHAVLLAGNHPETGESWKSRLDDWREFCSSLEIEIVAEIFSDYHGEQDTIPTRDEGGVFRGSVHYLERGEDVSTRPTVRRLARILAEMASGEE